MWRKPEHSKTDPEASSSPELAASHSAPAASPQSSSAPATVNQHIKIQGEISGQGDFLLDGELEGKVRIDGTFTVGSSGHARAQIEARQIIVRGEVVGSLKAHERLQIFGTAKVTGDMDARGLAIEDGAELHSKVATPRAPASQPAASRTPSPEPTVSEQPAEASRLEPSKRAKGAAASASPSPSQPDAQEP